MVLVVVLLALAGACGSGDGPRDVSANFWGALVDGDAEAARQWATPETAGSIQANGDGGNGDYTLGEPIVEEGKATVPTTLVSNDNGMTSTYDLQTVLVRHEGEWRVDVNRTMMSMFGGAMEAMMEGMGDAMEDAMGELAEGMQQGMEDMAREMSNEGSN
jgi:hypothetical protein